MRSRTWQALRRGAEAAVVASVPQVLVAKAEEKLLLPEGESADIGPRFIEELAARAQRELPEDMKWLGASAFHFGYAVFWGVLYALLQERRRTSPLAGGLLLSGFIYAITFPNWGGAVLFGGERPPRERSWRRELVLATAPLTFGLGTAYLYGRGPSGDGPAPARERSAEKASTEGLPSGSDDVSTGT